MNLKISSELFGTLEGSNDTGTVHLECTIPSVLHFQAVPLHITGNADAELKAIVDLAERSHRIFLEKEQQIRKESILQVLASDYGSEEESKIPLEQLMKGFNRISIINYFTDEDEVSIYYEQAEGTDYWFGLDLNVVLPLDLSEVSAGLDG